MITFGSRKRAENLMASRGVAVTCKESSCATKAIFFLTSISVGSTEKLFSRTSEVIRIFPFEVARPARILRRDVLPDPEGPMRAVTAIRRG